MSCPSILFASPLRVTAELESITPVLGEGRVTTWLCHQFIAWPFYAQTLWRPVVRSCSTSREATRRTCELHTDPSCWGDNIAKYKAAVIISTLWKNPWNPISNPRSTSRLKALKGFSNIFLMVGSHGSTSIVTELVTGDLNIQRNQPFIHGCSVRWILGR